MTFYRHVLPILQAECQTCHRQGGANLGGMVAPMALVSYQGTRPWARAIARQVQARSMPPWHAAPEQNGVFENERTLSDGQIATLVRWAETGAPAGDSAHAPPALEHASGDGWLIGEPDLVVEMPRPFLIEDEIDDLYVTFESTITADMLPEARWVQAVEFRPGSSAVHHIVAAPLGGMASGNGPTIVRPGYGRLLRPDTVVQWKMHYHKEAGPGSAVRDRSRAAIRFFPRGYRPKRVIQSAPMSNRWFVIPAGEASYTNTIAYTFERDAKIVSLMPHAHLRGRSAVYTARYPDGRRETLLEVPRYDFNWQTTYRFKKEHFMPAGSSIELRMTWDNSAANASNPDPSRDVAYGQPTTAEMMEGYVEFTDAVDGFLPEHKALTGAWTLRELLHQRLGVDLDSLSPEDRQRLVKQVAERQSMGASRH